MKGARVAIVTGGGTGIGQATSKRLADEYAVVVVYSRSADGANNTVKAIVDRGGKACAMQADISVESEVIKLFEVVKEQYGRVDVVVNNAGIGHLKPFQDISMEEYDYIFNINTRGTFMMCREAARVMEDSGRIINVSTGATKSNASGQALYTASKIAVEGFTKVLARELGPRGIAVNVVSPGMTDTPMLEGGNPEKLRQYGAKAAAMQRCGEPEDIADAIAALVSDDCRWITGENISVSGGTSIV
ncbi:SDR family oxidoreductase [Parahaliea sp. F7430]|uniref:SDR family oxidoreductase n=1 Tax=Sediminihaliea albiluteola TaxID=2758564 RepID=A0A7W2YK66_9GAMM|nr:SDR family oxidoreductase [Sediminihaliea albiluteola]MBA6413359.1 SDR family oxidoreductase [Sediminihaliea albiluteola]